jgi:DNA-binding transcriptional LysR family regulator
MAPQASASMAVQRLEASLGTRLLHRTTRRVQLTPDGQTFYERCKDVLADLDEMQAMFQPAASGLRVDMPMRVAHDVVVPLLPAFLQAHPGIELELSSTDRRVDVVRVREYRLVHYVGTLGQRCPGFEWVDADGQPQAQAMGGVLTVSDSGSYTAACLAGLGIIQVPRHGSEAEIMDGRLCEVLPGFQAAPMAVHLLYPHRRQLPRRVQVFMQWLAEQLAPRLIG